MLRLQKVSLRHEDLFIERYERLRLWALQLTHNDRSQAEDLLHDAFIQFTITQPNLKSIQNLDGYLYGTLRNLQLSQVRKATRSRLQQLSIVEYESAETGLHSLKAIDSAELIQIQDELRRVCHYVCVRKETARAASVLLLRFFHGYYTSEIARLLKTSPQAVRVRLRIARAEARTSIENPRALSFLIEHPLVEVLAAGFARSPKDLLSELRQAIFQSRRGDCLPIDQLRDLYRSHNSSIDTKELAHIVSCNTCLEGVNHLLDLPSLAERSPIDSVDRDKPSRGGPGSGAVGGGAPSGGGTTMNSGRRQAREVFEHDPQELCVAINGYMQGSQRINSELNELTLDIDLTEPINFIEIFSEQQIRMLLMNVDERPPEGPGEQGVRVALSEGRSLELQLKFGSPWPTLHVAYHDPTFKEMEGLAQELSEHDTPATALPIEPLPVRKHTTAYRQLTASAAQLWRRLIDGTFWIKPSTVTVVLVLLAVAVALLISLRRAPEPPLTAMGLLDRARAAEEAVTSATDQVLHRTITLEERQVTQGSVCRDGCPGELISRRRIDVWQSHDRGIVARRLYDEQDQLIAGDWRRSDGVQTLYHHGTKPQLQIRNPQFEIRNFDSVWLLSPSAKEFSQLIGNSATTRLEEQTNQYVITFQSDSASSKVKSAALVLSRADLHPIEETVLIRQAEEIRQYRLLETSFERRPPSTVAPAVFEPDPQLLSRTQPGPPDSKKEAENPSLLPFTTPRFGASPRLEIEALQLLSSVGADLGQEVSVERSSDGSLLIQGVVDTDRRKSEILQALRPVSGDRAVKIDLITTAEAARRQAASQVRPNTIEVQPSAQTENKIPAYAELERYFRARALTGDQLNAEVLRFSERTLSHSRQVLLHAGALKRLTARFSLEDLRTLDQDSRSKWVSLIRAHAGAIQRENSLLRQELTVVFSPTSVAEESGEIGIKDDAEVFRAAERLFDLCAQADHSISAAFVLSSGGATAATIRTPQFWRTLSGIDRQANEIQRALSVRER